MPTRLTSVDDLIRPNHGYIAAGDECYFWGEYQVRAGYAACPTNQLISNIKISPLHRGAPRYFYKNRDIERAGRTLRGVLRPASTVTVVPVPPSKRTDDPEYDDRMVQIARHMVQGTQSEVRELVRQTESYAASHIGAGSNRMTPQQLLAIYEVNDPGRPPLPTVIVLDDVLTQGAHFNAMKSLIISNFPQVRVVGIFLARAVDNQPLP